MKVSIITVCLNSADTIESAIESVRAQTHGDVEYIIVDGGSVDATMEIIGRHESEIDCVISEPDLGIYDAMNKGIARATGDVIGMLNSDDFYESPDVIANVAAEFEQRPEADAIFGDVVFVSPQRLDKIVRYYDANHFRSWKLALGWMPPHPATFMRASTYRTVGQYSLDYTIAADFEWFVRMLLVKKLNIARMNKVLVRMRTGGHSTRNWKSSWTLNAEIVQACRSHGIYTNLLIVLCKLPFKLLELVRRPRPA